MPAPFSAQCLRQNIFFSHFKTCSNPDQHRHCIAFIYNIIEFVDILRHTYTLLDINILVNYITDHNCSFIRTYSRIRGHSDVIPEIHLHKEYVLLESWPSKECVLLEYWPSKEYALLEYWPSKEYALLEYWPSKEYVLLDYWPSKEYVHLDYWPSKEYVLPWSTDPARSM